MASESRRTTPSLIKLLEEDPGQFGFFQAVRILEWSAARQSADGRLRPRLAVGGDGDPGNEAARFRSTVSLVHPTREIASTKQGADGGPLELSVPFLGLFGPSGVLPEHYTEQVIEAIRSKNTAYRDFLDMLNHRTISLFYRAWAKHRLPVAQEKRHAAAAASGRGSAANGKPAGLAGNRVNTAGKVGDNEDLFGLALSSLVGISTPGLSNRLGVDDELLLHYSGHLSNRRRSAAGVSSMIADLLGRPVEIRQFCGAWLEMDVDSRTRLPTVMEPAGRHSRLGVDAIIGARAWDVQAGFTIRVGPLNLADFRDLMPGSSTLGKLTDLVRFAVGPAQAFSVQPVLKGDQVPALRLTADPETGPRLGWNTWIPGAPGRSKAAGRPAPDRDDAAFTMADFHRASPASGARA